MEGQREGGREMKRGGGEGGGKGEGASQPAKSAQPQQGAQFQYSGGRSKRQETRVQNQTLLHKESEASLDWTTGDTISKK